MACGGALLLASFVVTTFYVAGITQEAEDNEFFIGVMTLDPLDERSMDFTVDDASRPFYVDGSRVMENQLLPPRVEVRGEITDPFGETVASTPDVIEKILRVEPTATGTYRLHLTNTHSEEGITVMFTCTYGHIPTTADGTIAFEGSAVASLYLNTIGLLTLVFGGITFVMDWKKSKSSNKTVSP